MIITLDNVKDAVQTLKKAYKIGFDVETYGLRTFHGDRLFSLALACDVEGLRHKFYFNFHPYPEVPKKYILSKEILYPLNYELFSEKDILWFAHNAKFDLHNLAKEEIKVAGTVHCTKANGRVVYNEHQKYDLDSSLERIGLAKDDAVERYIEEHELWEQISVPGKRNKVKLKFFDKVPFHIIATYAMQDASGTLDLGLSQERDVEELDSKLPDGVPPMRNVLLNERLLTKTVQRMEFNGCRINRDYCIEAIAFHEVALWAAQSEIEEAAGRPFKNSGKFLAELFKGQEHNFSRTEKGALSFDSDALEKIEHPLVDTILRYRSTKNSLDFYQGFLYHADSNDVVHPSFNPDVARHGRFSSSNPNFQNLKAEDASEISDEDKATKFYVRRAVIPREGNIFLLPDYKSMEYKMMLEYACRISGRVVALAQMVLDGMDFHDATVQLVRDQGYDILRKKAKIANFLTLYEGGPGALATALKCDIKEAKEIQNAINRACPEALKARRMIIDTAKRRGFVFNWYGRRCWFPNSRVAYRAPNYVDSGGCADVMKIAMNEVDKYLIETQKESMMVLTIHDELGLDCPRAEAREVAFEVTRIMEKAFPAQYVPMTVDMEYSEISLFDKVKGYPT